MIFFNDPRRGVHPLAKKTKLVFFAVSTLLVLNLRAGFSATDDPYQTGGVEPIEPSTTFGKGALLVGGGGNFALANSDVVDSGLGGSAAVRLTLAPNISLETSLDFISFQAAEVDERFFKDLEKDEDDEDDDEDSDRRFDKIKVDTSGSVSSLMIFPALMLHFEGKENASFYFLAGAGYQFNQTKSFNAKVTGFEEEEDSDDEDPIFTKTPLTIMEVEVSDGFIFGLGAGADLLVTPHIVINVDLRYQFGAFDVSQKGVFEGRSLELEKDVRMDALICRARLFYRF